MTVRTSQSFSGLFGWVLYASLYGYSVAQLPTNANKESAAVKLLSHAVDEFGGLDQWRSIHAVRVTGSFSRVTKAADGLGMVTSDIDWLDDWSTGKPRYTRSTRDGRGTHLAVHDGNLEAKTSVQGKAVSIRQFDASNVLLLHLPAAALTLILDGDRYYVRQDPRSSTVRDIAIDVSTGDGTCNQKWLISRVTGTVDAVRFGVPDALKSTNQAFETVIYTHYDTEGSLVLPNAVTVIRPGGQPMTFQFNKSILNPSFAAGAFTKGAAQ